MNPDLPPIICITLAQTPERTEQCRRRLAKLGLTAEFWNGIHGTTFGIKSIKSPKETTQNFIGCLLSHYMVWEALKHRPESEFLIIEDDAVFPNDFVETYAFYRRDLPLDWMMAFVGHKTADGIHVIPVPSNRKFIRLKPPDGVWVSHCYLVRKEILPYLTFRMHVARHSPDEQLNELVLPNIAWYAFWPSLVAQDSERRTGPEFKASECYDYAFGRWSYSHLNDQVVYGNAETYQIGMNYLADCDCVEDWGCGTAVAKRYCQTKYVSVDGSWSKWCDKIANLVQYKSAVDGIFMRHVLEHNWEWEQVLSNAMNSFKKKFALIMCHSWVEKTRYASTLEHYPYAGIGQMEFCKGDILRMLSRRAVIEQELQFKNETIFLVKRAL